MYVRWNLYLVIAWWTLVSMGASIWLWLTHAKAVSEICTHLKKHLLELTSTSLYVFLATYVIQFGSIHSCVIFHFFLNVRKFFAQTMSLRYWWPRVSNQWAVPTMYGAFNCRSRSEFFDVKRHPCHRWIIHQFFKLFPRNINVVYKWLRIDPFHETSSLVFQKGLTMLIYLWNYWRTWRMWASKNHYCYSVYRWFSVLLRRS